MRKKVLNALLLATSLVGYLEWGDNQSVFLVQAEAELFVRAFREPGSVIHPFTLLPVAGQIALLWTFFQATPSRVLTYVGIAGIGLLLALMCLIGLIGPNVRILVSTLPFLTLSAVTIREHWRSGA